ncbi:ribosomal RNA-processing protein 8 [Brienomyrus brachyistius]|uniref:ribosomal RNA-processing protein 8 n=1 Tax=Brienomyrus brachyistius TaxID=42636 RepID=UPI0020B2A7FC|nr:ribosomal RNA-processing protein 8 [Brienomyrus brachyistius]
MVLLGDMRSGVLVVVDRIYSEHVFWTISVKYSKLQLNSVSFSGRPSVSSVDFTKSMFAEEAEWNDGPEAKALTEAVIHGTPMPENFNATTKISRKRSLLRTLHTLGSLPTWTNGTAHEASEDSETEGTTLPAKRRKKRSKKHRRSAPTEDESKQKEAEVVPGTIVIERKKKEKIPEGSLDKKNTKPVNESEGVDFQKETSQIAGKEETRLSRQQWKNKMKNKRKCKNKYMQNDELPQSVPKADENRQIKNGGNPDMSMQEEGAPTQKNKTKRRKQDTHNIQLSSQHAGAIEANAVSVGGDTTQKEQKEHKPGRIKGESQVAGESSCRVSKSREVNSSRNGEEKKDAKIKSTFEVQQQIAQKKKLQKMLQHGEAVGKGRIVQEETEDSHSGVEEERGKTTEGIIDRSAALKFRMEQRLEAARFRYINEQLYTSTSSTARRMFKQDPQAFDIYHRGFTTQVQHWPANPVDAIIAYIKHKPATRVVADFGCGDCKIARSVRNKVHSFDLAPVCDIVTVCDMANVPLPNASVDIAVFCLSLMGTNLRDFLVEASRVLVMGGVLKIAEVASRFENVRSFLGALSALGFRLVSKDTENRYFYSFEFVKTGNAPEKSKTSGLELKPCVYKKR